MIKFLILFVIAFTGLCFSQSNFLPGNNPSYSQSILSASTPTNVYWASDVMFGGERAWYPQSNASSNIYTHSGIPFRHSTTVNSTNYYAADFNASLDATGCYEKTFIADGDVEVQILATSSWIRLKQNGQIINDYQDDGSGAARFLRITYSDRMPRLFSLEFAPRPSPLSISRFAGIGINTNNIIAPYKLNRLKVAVIGDSINAALNCPSMLWAPWKIVGNMRGWEVANYATGSAGFATNNLANATTNFVAIVPFVTQFDPDVVVGCFSSNDSGVAQATLEAQINDFALKYAASNACQVVFQQRFPTTATAASANDGVVGTLCTNQNYNFITFDTKFYNSAMATAWRTNAWTDSPTSVHYNSNGVIAVSYFLNQTLDLPQNKRITQNWKP